MFELSWCNMSRIMSSGQCFRIKEVDKDSYLVLSTDRCCLVKQSDNMKVVVYCNDIDESYWMRYFDLGRDYPQIYNYFLDNITDDYIRDCVLASKGLRLLNQDAFETLISFIISSQNNVPQISKSIDLMCNDITEEKSFMNYSYHPFPNLRQLLNFDLANKYSLGFHANYIAETCKLLFNEDISLNSFPQDLEIVVPALKRFKGVGDKIANCIALYGMGCVDAYTKNTWFDDILQDVGVIKYLGILQLYIHYYTRL